MKLVRFGQPGAEKPGLLDKHGTIRDLSYFGSFTVFHVELPSGQRLKVSQANTERHQDDRLGSGDAVWAHWSRSAHVVLTQ